jgi:Tfp pilus assembly protein PilF
MVAIAQNRPQDAIDPFQRGVTAQDTDATRMRLALAQVRAGHAGDGEKTLTSWIDANPRDAIARNGLAQLYMDEKKFALARDQYAEIFRQAPDNAVAENNLAWTMSLLGQDDEALQHAQHAAAAAPNAAGVLDTLGVIELKAGQVKEARETLEKSATGAPDVPSIQFHFAQVLAQTGEKNRARDILRRVLDNQQPFDERGAAQKLLDSLSS